MKTKLTQRRIKARNASACGLCKPWKQGGADKKTVRDLRHAVRAEQQLREAGCWQVFDHKRRSRTFARPGLTLHSRMTNLANPSPSRKRRTPTSVWLRVREEYQQGLGS